MDLSQIGLFNGLVGKMDWLVQRQGVIAQNIANADTPQYESQDIAPFSFKTMLKKLAPVATDAAHIQVSASGDANGDAKVGSALHDAYEVKPDGNAVTTEQEMKKAADTAADYQLATNIYKKSVSLLELALGRNG